MPNLYVFSSTTGRAQAVTDDRSGSKLPARKYGTWAFSQEITVNAEGGQVIGADSDEILNDIKKHGYHLWAQES